MDTERFRTLSRLAERYVAEGTAAFDGLSPEDADEVRRILASDADPLDQPLIGASQLRQLADAVLDGRRPAPPAPDVPGLELVRHVGQGSHADVWEALERQPPRRRVAIKVLSSHGSRTRFDIERAVIGRMSHEGIARVHSAGTTGLGHPYLVMEFVDGLPFIEACAAYRLDRRERVRLLAATARAVQHAHDRGVLHRDLKSSNVLVAGGADAPCVKVIDFGIAKAMVEGIDAASTLAGQLVGTPASMSPEQRSGQPEAVDVRTDVYALGSILFEAIAERPRWDLGERNLVQALDHIARTPPLSILAAVPDLSPDLAAIIETSLASRPAERYASAAALADDLERWLRSEPVTARRAPWVRRAAWWVRRNRVAATVAGGLAIGLLGVSTAGVVSYQAQSRENTQLRQWMTTAVAALKDLADVPGSLEQRDRLSAFVLAKIAELPPSSDLDQRLILADAYHARSDVLRQRGELPDATALRRDALALIEAAREARPGDRDLARRYAFAEILLGDVAREADQSEEALARYAAAHAVLLDLADDAAATVADRGRLAFSHDRLCDVTAALGSEERGLGTAESRAALRRQAREHAEAMAELAMAMRRGGGEDATGGLHASVAAQARLIATAPPGTSDEALSAMHDAVLRDAELLVAVSPRNRTFAHLLSARVADAALHHSASGRAEISAELLARSIARLEILLESEPDQLDTRQRLADNYANLVVVELRRSAYEAARAAVAEGLAVAKPLLVAQPLNPAYSGVVERLETLAEVINQNERRGI